MFHSIVNLASGPYARVRRLIEKWFYDRRNGIDTTDVVELDAHGLAGENREDYYPTPWLALRRILKSTYIGHDDVFLDYGCGKGRVLYRAAMYPFRRIIGVEISPELAAIARANIDRSLPKLKCKNVEVANADAVHYEVPDDVTVVYFFDPFHGHVFEGVLNQLRASLSRRPRTLTIIYLDPHEEQTLLRAGAVLVRSTQGFRPSKRWAQEKSIRVYKFA